MPESPRQRCSVTSSLCAYWFLSVTLGTAEISAVPLGVIHEALEAIPQQQTFPIVLCLRDQGQQYISHLGSDFVSAKEVQRLSQIQHFCDRGRFLHRVATKRLSESGELSMQFRVCSGRSLLQDSCLRLDRRVPETQEETPA